MSTIRQQAVRRLDPASFEGTHGKTDIKALMQGIYATAQKHRCLEAVARDADLATLNMQRAGILQRPAQPAQGALAAVLKHYEHTKALYTEQSTALAELKNTILQAMDQEALSVIEDPVHGTLNLSVLDILNALTAQYQDMTNQELMVLQNELTAVRWDASTDLVSFLTDFVARVAFLDQHAFAPTVGAQVITLQNAVAHVPAFAQKADAAFYLEFRQRADQTLTHLVSTYRRVYRTEYVNTTAAELHSAHQVQARKSSEPQEPALDLIMASARAIIRDTTITPAIMDKLVHEVTLAVTKVLRPSPEATQRGGRSRGGTQQAQGGRNSGNVYVPPVAPASGYCPLHPTNPHTWDQCRLNPDKKA